jgi:hypothetical protein
VLVTWIRPLSLATALLVVVGCTEGLRGVPMKEPSATGKVVASVSANEPGGLQVLWNGPVVRQQDRVLTKWSTWVAGSQEELDAVWKAAAKGLAPSVDFASYVVFAATGPHNCLPPIRGLDIEASGLMLLRKEDIPVHSCRGDAVPVARIIAVPRSALPTTVVFLEGYAFEVPDVPFG